MRRIDVKAFRNWTGGQVAASAALASLVLLLAGLTLLILLARSADRAAVAAERAALREAVAEQRRATLAALADVAGRGQVGFAADPEDRRLNQVVTLVHGDIIGPDGATAPLAAPLREALLRLATPVARKAAPQASAILPDGSSGLYDAAAITAPIGAATGAVLIGLRRIDIDWLGRIALATGDRALRLVRQAAHPLRQQARLPLGQDQAFALAWQPDRPGDGLLLPGAILLGLGTLLAWRRLSALAPRAATQNGAGEAAGALPTGSHDWLSGLPNRVYFNHVLERELKTLKTRDCRIALLYIDLDRFKDINDTFGIETGDAMIQAVTQRIATLVRPIDLIARFEGDAFLVLQRDIRDRQACERFAQQLLAAMRQPFMIDGARLSASLSIGVAVAPEDATERTELMQVANLALFRAKREGRNRMAFYKPKMDGEWRRLKTVETQLRDAINHQGLVLRYQPIVASHTGETVCVEALVRWQHPTEGLIAPDRFIGLAEDRGLILPLGEWVLRQACLDARDWPGIRVAVNVSPIQFRHPDFVATVCLILEETGLEPCRLELELTEGVLVENEEEAFVAIAELRDRGVRMALDDFGTGYSSLIYLRRFSFDKIKIDRAFIEALEPTGESAILVESVVRLGRALGLTVTAEGIETEEQRDFLKSLGCDELQGYLIARPLAKGDLGPFFGGEAPPGAGFGRRGPGTVLAVA